jgi:hypothetical protein
LLVGFSLGRKAVMADTAKYEILCPAMDLAQSTAKYLSQQLSGPAHVEPQRNVYQDGNFNNYAPVVITTEDTPQADSTVKQAAAYVAEIAGSDTIIVSKTGKDGTSPPGPRNSPPG